MVRPNNREPRRATRQSGEGHGDKDYMVVKPALGTKPRKKRTFHAACVRAVYRRKNSPECANTHQMIPGEYSGPSKHQRQEVHDGLPVMVMGAAQANAPGNMW